MSLGVVEDQSYSQDVDTTATGGAFDVAEKSSRSKNPAFFEIKGKS